MVVERQSKEVMRTYMKHYSPEQWADYSRGTAGKRQVTEMKRHLETGCRMCRQSAEMWSDVLKLAQKEIGYRPPESAVRVAKSFFALSRAEERPSVAVRLATLVFDSLRQPQPEGVRSSSVAPRHYVYQAGSVLVDVWMERAGNGMPLSLTGQVLEKSQAAQKVMGLDVRLRVGNTDIASTKTNQFGEFHLELPSATASDVQLTIGDDRKIAVLIPMGFIGDAQEGNDH
jgi:hypothetical protein